MNPPTPTCEYLVKPEDGPRRPCGKAATHFARRPHGTVFHYCENCGANALESATRAQIRLNLIAIAKREDVS